ncbi:MAG: DNA-processing protein DprA [Deltaproteobacteria bacterium]|nr:DNA-processing protein DprA [Deltaproteobacteria bacterium]
MSNPTVLTLRRAERGYPPELARLLEPPEFLRMRGVLPPLTRAVAIVGTRAATERGLHVARTLAAELAQEGCVIVSGGAFGVDHAAHLGALDAHGTTIVVHATGLEARYPAEHAPLYERIVARGGCELSERDDHETPRPRHFLARNRIIAALSRAVIVVEAPSRSGALSTAAHARALDLPVLAVPRVPEHEEAVGSNDLLRSGALPCMAARDVLRVVESTPFLPFVRGARAATRRETPHRRGRSVARAASVAPDLGSLGSLSREVLSCLEEGIDELDAIVERLDRPVAEVLAAVAELELAGVIVQGRRGTLAVVG